MQAVIYERYGSPDVLQVREIAQPAPKNDEVLIRVRATTVTSADCRLRSLSMPRGFGLISRLVLGITRPRQRVLGVELAGEIVAVGRGVSKFKLGDEVFAISGASLGCYAEYKCLSEDAAIALKPTALTFAEAATLAFAGTTALDFLRRGQLQRGERVLINGASGAVGTAAVQLAKYFGAEVTAVCSAANGELVRSLGADHVIDYTAEDFTRNGETYDVIVDTVGTAPFSRSKGSLSERGRLLLVLAGLADMLMIPWVSMSGSRRVIAGPAAERAEDLHLLARLVQEGHFRPVIDRCYPFERIAEAHRYVDSGRKRGNVAVILGGEISRSTC